jgi:ribosomal protein L6P/L9E
VVLYQDIYKDEELVVPEDVTVVIKARQITVEGPRGKLVKVTFFLRCGIFFVFRDSRALF